MSRISELRCLDQPTAVGIRERQPSDAVLDELAVRAAGLSDPTRVAIALALRPEDEICVCDVSWILDRPLKTISHHLGRMRAAGLVSSRQDGRLVMYRLTDAGAALLDILAP